MLIILIVFIIFGIYSYHNIQQKYGNQTYDNQTFKGSIISKTNNGELIQDNNGITLKDIDGNVIIKIQ